jgi:CheY-like chemotaxis protein
VRQLLWVDDDGPHRFRYEEAVLLEDHNWRVTWSSCVEQAVEFLACQPFASIVLDQMLPLRNEAPAVGYWGGYSVLHWLKRCKDPIPPPPIEHQQLVEGREPLKANIRAPVCIISAFEDLTVQGAIRKASPTAPIPIYAKPLELQNLERFLGCNGVHRD